jgi:hypothetical protein
VKVARRKLRIYEVGISYLGWTYEEEDWVERRVPSLVLFVQVPMERF